ncbi:EamA family transporter [bacterium]|nr:EamA family transporter [bacterium]
MPFERLLFAIGIRYVGETVSKVLVKEYQHIEHLITTTYCEKPCCCMVMLKLVYTKFKMVFKWLFLKSLNVKARITPRNTSCLHRKSWTLMIVLAFIWGSSFILMKKGLIVFNDIEVAQLRMGIAWLSLLPFVWKKLFNVEKKHIIPILVVGLFGNGFP